MTWRRRRPRNRTPAARSIFLFCAFFWIWIWGFLLQGVGRAATAGKVEISGLYSVDRTEFLDMLGVRQGEEIDREVVRYGIRRAFLKGVFEDIIVRVPDGENPVVAVDVKERDFIRKISVESDLDLSDKVIKGLFLLKTGGQMRYDLVDSAASLLREKVADYGYPEAQVHVKWEKTSIPHRVNIQLTIEGGRPLIIKDIEIVQPSSEGISAEAAGRAAVGSMKLSPGDVYNKVKLAADLKNIKGYYKKLGYYRPVIGSYHFEQGVLRISVDPGKRLSVRIEGNSAISRKNLMREVPFFEIEDFRDETIEEAIARMLALYHSDGYAFAQIAPVTNVHDQTIEITFFVFEGEKVRVKSIEFTGTSVPAGRLKDVMSLREGDVYNPDMEERDRESLKEFYGGLGYLDATVKDIETAVDKTSSTAQIVVHIDEGKRTLIGSVEITGADPGMKNKLMEVARVKPGDPYNEIDVSDARFRILDFYANQGYMNVDVTISRSVDDYKASVVLHVEEGKEKYFGKTIVIGNRKTRYKVFKRELLYKEGQPYSFRVINEERQKLYKLGLFTDVQVVTVDGEDDEKDVLLKVTEGNAGSFEFGFGYGDYEKFRGYAQVSYHNLWGMNREGLLRIEASSLLQRIILQYNEPWFLGRRLPLRVFSLYENKKEFDSGTKEILYRLHRYSLTAGVEKRLSDKMKSELYYEFSLVDTFDVKPDVILTKEDTGTLAISSVKPALVYDTRDNPFDPKKGVLAGISVKLAPFLLLSEVNFVKAEVYGSTFHKINRRVTLAVSARTGIAYSFGDTTELPLVERYFLGGRFTVRGYAQDSLGPKGADGVTPTGGNAYLMGNIEFRTDIGKGFGIVPFVDMGNVWLRTDEINPMQLRFTTGIGLRYNTPVGPLRIDYGLKLSRAYGESKGELHFSVGQAF